MCFSLLEHNTTLRERVKKMATQLVKSNFGAEAMGSNSPIGCILQNYAKGLGLSMKTNQYGRPYLVLQFYTFFLQVLLILTQHSLGTNPVRFLGTVTVLKCETFLHWWLCNLISFSSVDCKSQHCVLFQKKSTLGCIISVHQSREREKLYQSKGLSSVEGITRSLFFCTFCSLH